MLELRSRISVIAHKHNHIFLNPDFFTRPDYNIQERLLRHHSSRASIFQLESELLSRVGWVRRRDDAAGP
jgi:hypothetical protein